MWYLVPTRIIVSWERNKYKVKLPGRMRQPYYRIGLKMEPPLRLLRTQCQVLITSTACIAASSSRAAFVYGAGPGLPRPAASAFPWQSLAPHIAYFLISRTKLYVDMCNDRAGSRSCVLVAKEDRSLSRDSIEDAGLILWGCPKI